MRKSKFPGNKKTKREPPGSGTYAIVNDAVCIKMRSGDLVEAAAPERRHIVPAPRAQLRRQQRRHSDRILQHLVGELAQQQPKEPYNKTRSWLRVWGRGTCSTTLEKPPLWGWCRRSTGDPSPASTKGGRKRSEKGVVMGPNRNRTHVYGAARFRLPVCHSGVQVWPESGRMERSLIYLNLLIFLYSVSCI